MPHKIEDISPFDQDQEFWEKYCQGRPQVPDSFFTRIIDYHTQHGGSFSNLHDAGAGAGVHSARFARHFDHIILSDISDENMRVAQTNFQATTSTSTSTDNKYTFLTSRLQDPPGIPDASIDLFFTSSAIHFCGISDLPAAIDIAARQLKPGGTFFATATGLMAFPNEPKLQTLWVRLFQQYFADHLSNKPGKEVEAVQSVLAVCASAYDAIELPESLFEPGVERVKINWPKDWSWRAMNIPLGREDEIETVNMVGENDVLRFETDEGLKFRMNIEQLRQYRSTFPLMGDGGTAPIWKQIENLVGDESIEGVWPISLILATKKH